MDNLFVRPAPLLEDGKPVADGRTVLLRDPQSLKPLAAAGEWKTKNQFWLQRIREGDVIDDTAKQSAAQAVAPAAVTAEKSAGKNAGKS
jgi:hypothetical protein